MAERLLEVHDLQVSFATEDGVVRAVDGVSFTLDRGEVVAIVGESGSGKSVTSMTLMGLTRSVNSRFAGTAKLKGKELLTATEEELEKIRGAEIAMIFRRTKPARPERAVQRWLVTSRHRRAGRLAAGCRSPRTPESN